MEGLGNHKKDFNLKDRDIWVKIAGNYKFYFLFLPEISWGILAEKQNIYQNL